MNVLKHVKALLISIILLISFIIIPISGGNVSSSQNILYVGGNGPGNFSKIQAAIDAANPGDTVFVFNGMYHENIFIIKTINLVGEDKNNTIIDADRNGSVVYIIGNRVTLSGFTLQNSSREYYTNGGVEVYSADTHIKNNIIKNNRVGIHLLYARGLIPNGNNTIENNIIIYNEMSSCCIHCSNNKIIRNHIENNGGGIFLQQFARFNKVNENNLINNTQDAGHFRAIFNTWNKNYWDTWVGLKNPLLKKCPKMIPKYWPVMGELEKFPWPSFDFHPQNQPYVIC